MVKSGGTVNPQLVIQIVDDLWVSIDATFHLLPKKQIQKIPLKAQPTSSSTAPNSLKLSWKFSSRANAEIQPCKLNPIGELIANAVI